MMRWIPLVFLTLVALIVGCDRSPAPPAAPAGATQVTLQLNWLAEPQFGGFYAAEVNGDYQRNGLNVTIQPGGAGAPTVDMLAAGTVKFAIVSGDEIIVARARGKKIVGVFAVYQTHPQGILTHASRCFGKIDDVFSTAGTLAMEVGLPYSDFLKSRFGFDKLKIVPSPGGDLSIFRNDPQLSQQCFITSEPIAAKRLGLDVKTFLIAEAGYNPYATVLATTDDTLWNDRAAVVSMVKAVKAGWESYLADPSKANAHMATLNRSMDAQTFIDSAAAQKPLIQPDASTPLGTMTRARWQTLGEQLLQLKVIPAAPAPEECFIDPSSLLTGN